MKWLRFFFDGIGFGDVGFKGSISFGEVLEWFWNSLLFVLCRLCFVLCSRLAYGVCRFHLNWFFLDLQKKVLYLFSFCVEGLRIGFFELSFLEVFLSL